MSAPKLEYDSRYDGEYGEYRCPHCKVGFYGGGDVSNLHMKGCVGRERHGYASCIYVIGPQVIEEVRRYAATFGENAHSSNTGVSLADLKEQLPHLFT